MSETFDEYLNRLHCSHTDFDSVARDKYDLEEELVLMKGERDNARDCANRRSIDETMAGHELPKLKRDLAEKNAVIREMAETIAREYGYTVESQIEEYTNEVRAKAKDSKK